MAFAGASPAHAMQIIPVFDSSITSRSNASTIESAFNNVVKAYDSAFTDPAVIKVDVSWGSVDGQKLPTNALGASVDQLYGYFSYGQIKSWLTADAAANPSDKALVSAVANLPKTAPSGVSNYVLPSAEAKAMGLLSNNTPGYDGYIGFGSSYSYSFNPAAGVAANTFDFEAVAAHEIDEVLGRTSGLESTTPSFRTPFDLFRYSAPGQLSFNYSTGAYFSLNGGVTNLGNFNISSSGGDRSDWASFGSTASDIQAAFLSPGKASNLTAADLAALDALGYTGSNLGDSIPLSPTTVASNFISVPEPGVWTMMLVGLGGLGLAMRGQRRRTLATVSA